MAIYPAFLVGLSQRHCDEVLFLRQHHHRQYHPETLVSFHSSLRKDAEYCPNLPPALKKILGPVYHQGIFLTVREKPHPTVPILSAADSDVEYVPRVLWLLAIVLLGYYSIRLPLKPRSPTIFHQLCNSLNNCSMFFEDPLNNA